MYELTHRYRYHNDVRSYAALLCFRHIDIRIFVGVNPRIWQNVVCRTTQYKWVFTYNYIKYVGNYTRNYLKNVISYILHINIYSKMATTSFWQKST